MLKVKPEVRGLRGEARGETKILVSQLHHKFGPLSPEVQNRVAQASSAELSLWATRVLDAKSP